MLPLVAGAQGLDGTWLRSCRGKVAANALFNGGDVLLRLSVVEEVARLRVCAGAGVGALQRGFYAVELLQREGELGGFRGGKDLRSYEQSQQK